jgi:hypothetical protein
MDHDEDGTAFGRYIHIKVKLDIRKPLMRGVTIQLDEKGRRLPGAFWNTNSSLTFATPEVSLATPIGFVT